MPLNIEFPYPKDWVVVLGSGKSILDLTDYERSILDSCKVKIGINKYSAFYELAGIEPTHIYFFDDHDKSAMNFLKLIFEKFVNQCKKNKTFIVSKNYQNYLFESKIKCCFLKYRNTFIINLKTNTIKFGRYFFKKISIQFFNEYKRRIEGLLTKDSFRFTQIPKQSTIQFIDNQNWLDRGNKWAKTIQEPLYHYRGSLSSVFNYISICFPNKKVLLVGVDLNTDEYFFENELKNVDFNTTDWTTAIVKGKKKHFSIIDFNGTKIDDELPFMIKNLKLSGNLLFSVSKSSYLVSKGFVQNINFSNIINSNDYE